MKKSIRFLALIAALTLSAAPAMHAEIMGGNPRPYSVAAPISWASVAYAVFSMYAL